MDRSPGDKTRRFPLRQPDAAVHAESLHSLDSSEGGIWMDFNQASLDLCERNRGKLEVISKAAVTTRDELSTAYTPGVAEPCRQIHANRHEL